MKTHDHSRNSRGASLSGLTDRLRREARKITSPRQAILDVMQQGNHPLTTREIFDGLPPGHCDLATVYRSIHLLEEMGMVKRFDFGDGVARYELLAEGDDGHHHHLVCIRCSEIVELDECFSSDLEQKIASNSGYRQVTHRLEFFGVCPKCQ